MESKHRVTDLVADLLGEIRQDSPRIRQAENKAQSQFSPQSPLSPEKGTEIESVPTRPQFRIRFKDGRTFLQSHSAGVALEEVRAFNEREWGPVASVVSEEWR